MDGATNTHTHTQRIGPKGLYLDLQPRGMSAEDQGSWLPGRERAAGRPLLLGVGGGGGALVAEGRASAAEPG